MAETEENLKKLARSHQDVQQLLDALRDQIRDVLPEFVIVGVRVRTEEEMALLQKLGRLEPDEGQATVFFYARANSVGNMLAIMNGGLEKMQEQLRDNEEVVAITGDGEKTTAGMRDQALRKFNKP